MLSVCLFVCLSVCLSGTPVCCLSVCQGHLYAIGGNNGTASLDTCERYDPHVNKWTSIEAMKKRRAGAGVAQLHGYLYVVGMSSLCCHVSLAVMDIHYSAADASDNAVVMTMALS